MLCLMACLRYCVEFTMRIRKKKIEKGICCHQSRYQTLPKGRNETLPRCQAQSRHAILLILSPGGSRPVRSRPRRRPRQIPGRALQHQGRSSGWVLQTKSIAKSVLMATRIPLLLLTYSLSSEASAAFVPQTGYSPPAPKPATPRPTIIIQKSLQR
jgi:hypothetical protein